MRSSPEQTPEIDAFLGVFTAKKANIARDAIASDRRDLLEVRGELRGMEQLAEEKGVISPEHEELIQLYKEYIDVVEKSAALNRREFEAACDEAGELIGPGTPGDRVLTKSLLGSQALSNC